MRAPDQEVTVSLTLLLFLTGCRRDLPIIIDTGTAPPQLELTRVPIAPWGPFYVTDNGNRRTDTAPVAIDEAGQPAMLRPLETPGTQTPYGWAGDLAPGAWTATIDEDTRDFLVEPYGRSPAFDHVAIQGNVYELDTDGVWIPVPQMDLEIAQDHAVWLEVVDADPTSAHFRLWGQANDAAPACVMIDDTGTLSSTGELSWQVDRLELPTTPDPTAVVDPTLRLGFDGQGETAAGLALTFGMDVRLASIESFGWEDAVCHVPGADCYPCDGEDSLCMDTAIHGGVMPKVSIDLGGPIPCEPDGAFLFPVTISCDQGGVGPWDQAFC